MLWRADLAIQCHATLMTQPEKLIFPVSSKASDPRHLGFAAATRWEFLPWESLLFWRGAFGKQFFTTWKAEPHKHSRGIQKNTLETIIIALTRTLATVACRLIRIKHSRRMDTSSPFLARHSYNSLCFRTFLFRKTHKRPLELCTLVEISS